MAIRKDIDDMLNILKTGKNPEAQEKKQVHEPVKTHHDSVIDKMSVDDLLSSLTAPKPETAHEPEVRIEPEIKAKTKEQDTVNPENKPKKKRIVITGELPDYEALRAKELEHDRLERERIEAEKRAAEKAERERIKAEKARAEAEKKAAEEAEKERLAAEHRAAEAARIEAERKAENARLEAERRAMEQARLEAQRKAAEEARLEEERRAAEQAQLEEERKAAEQARLEEERKAAEQARLEEERRAAEQARLEKERKAAEQARLEEERRAAEEAEKISAEDTSAADSDPESAAEENLSEPTLDELMDAAIAAAKAEEEKFLAAERAAQELSEYDPVENMIGNIREDAEKAAEEIEELHEEPKQSEEAPEEAPPSLAEIEAELDDELFGKKKNKKKRSEKTTNSEESDLPPKKQGKISSALENILDEDPDEIIARRSENNEPDIGENYSGGKLKKTLYTIFGIIFFLLACIGLITVIAKAVEFFGSYASGDTQKGSFKEVLYPAVIMDIESFNEPVELPSDQIITAAIWSMIMSDSAMKDYEQTFDVVKIPAVDVESYAVKLFGENIPELTHTTVGPAESRFYYNEETKSYNVPVAPVTYTYAPSVRSATKNGSEYAVVVDYIDELPEWLPETSSKSVEFTLTETGEGYMLKAMKILSTTSNSL